MKKPITNMAASVHARLLKRAKAEGRPFNELLQYYGMERFLYRLSRSAHAERFVLKGALMLQLWGAPLTRATKDIDLLGHETTSVEEIVGAVRSCLEVDVDDDGLRFDAETVTGEPIRLDANYDGVRVRCAARLGNARITLQIDVGFGDVITPGAQPIVYPTLLGFDAPRMLGYPAETSIAEKLEAMVVLDIANTRLKDFLDIWMLARACEFSSDVLAEAIEATFRRRRTAVPESTPVALTQTFHTTPGKRAQWRAYIRKARVQGDVPDLDEAVTAIRSFLMPVVDSLAAKTRFDSHWCPGGPWAARPKRAGKEDADTDHRAEES